MVSSDNQIVLTCANATNCITTSSQITFSFISSCNHEEADTRVFLHVNYMSLKGHSKITVRTVDTDVLVIAASVFARSNERLEELWIDFGTGKHRQFVPIHVIFSNLGQSKALGLPFLHAFTGCDSVSYFKFLKVQLGRFGICSMTSLLFLKSSAAANHRFLKLRNLFH